MLSEEIERWLPVVGYEGTYEVSDWGRVRRAAAGSGTRAGRIVSPTPVPAAYPLVSLSRNNLKRSFALHRLVTAAFLGPRPLGTVVNHKDAHRLNNRLVNLEYVSLSENARHSYRLGYHGKTNAAKLTFEQVAAIRSLSGSGLSHARIAVRFGVSRTTVTRILLGTTWQPNIHADRTGGSSWLKRGSTAY
jgi:predicted DNA-binding protein (UPF0251 family)